MQRGQAQVTGLRISDSGRHRLLVAHLADQNAIGGLAQRVAQADLKVERVGADLALIDDGFLVLENELDRIFEREDVA